MADRKRLFQRFTKSVLILCLISAFAFTILVFGITKYQAGQQLELLKAREQARVNLTRGLLMRGFDYAANDLLAVANLPEVHAYNRSRQLADKNQLENVFSIQLEQKPTFSQLRFLDADGVELIRLDRFKGRNLVTPQNKLQQKSGRYYVQGVRPLSEGEVYVSPLDLNVERGLIDIPYLPTVRFGTPVYDRSTGNRGLLVLNVGAKLLLDQFRLSKSRAYDAFLLNSEGHILSGPESDQEWSFMFGLPPAFKREYPQVWAQILQRERGDIETPAGVFLFETVYPLQRIGALPAVNAGESTAESYFWKTVTFIPHDALPTTNPLRNPWFIASYLGGLALVLLLVFYLRFSQYKRQLLRRENAVQARRFRDMSNVLGEGLIVMDQAGVVTYVNPEAERILGWQAEELELRKGHQAFHFHHEDEASCPILGVMKTRETYRSKDEVFCRKDGTKIPVSLNATPLNDESDDTDDMGVVVSFQDFTEIKDYQAQIRRLAFQDALTGLPNRRVLDDHLELAVAQAQRHGQLVALMFLDLDQFKEVNDTYGHDAGDLLLKEVATRIKGCIRRSDTAIRLGGDEFIVLLPEVSVPDNAQVVAEKIIQTIGEPIELPAGKAQVGASIGIALMRSPDITTEDLMHQADTAMYEAKRKGKNQSYLWSRQTSGGSEDDEYQ